MSSKTIFKYSEKLTQENTNTARKFFEEADTILSNAVNDKNSTISSKIDSNGHIKKEYISEAYIEETFLHKKHKRPIVDLVQQGGGMFGVALLGYTYVMEKLGIRFYSHGGASAGGINALFMAAVSNDIYKETSPFSTSEDNSHPFLKSELLTQIIANTEFHSFMDREGVIGKLQRKILRNLKNLGVFMSVFSLLTLVTIYGVFGLVFNLTNGLSGTEIRFYDFVIGTLNVCALFVFIYILLAKIMGRNFGINKGQVFYNWADTILKDIGVHSTKDLEERMQEVEVISKEEGAPPKLVLISSDLTHNRIVKFPEEANFYWKNYLNIKPVAFLRATMSIPFIFKVFIPSKEHYYKDVYTNSVKINARFVDGGMLSNFPIREFHPPKNITPRFPTFGVLLSERKNMENSSEKIKWYNLKEISLLRYIASFISTFRNFYDNDFLNRNKEISIRTVTVDTKKFNWLNFWMTETEKIELFKEGANAAIRQLEKFDWENYKKIRNDG